MKYYFDIHMGDHCPVQGFTLTVDQEYLSGVDFVLKEASSAWTNNKPGSLHKRAQRQIELYLAGELQNFDLPMMPKGTEFQRRVWADIAAIPYGTTVTYGQIAKRLGDIHLARAVGQAANKNPLPVIIPCHRVVGSNGKLTGFAPGIATKVFLLDLEKRVK